MPVESGILWQAHQLSLMFSENVSLSFRRSGQLQDFFHVLLAHPPCGSICACLTDRKTSGVPNLASELVMEFHIQEDSRNGCQEQAHTLQAIPAEGLYKADQWIPVWRSNLRSTPHTTGIHPDLIVRHELSEKPAQVQ